MMPDNKCDLYYCPVCGNRTVQKQGAACNECLEPTRANRYLKCIVEESTKSLAKCGPGTRNETLFKSARGVFSVCTGLHLESRWHWVFGEYLSAGLASGLDENETSRTLLAAAKACLNLPLSEYPSPLFDE